MSNPKPVEGALREILSNAVERANHGKTFKIVLTAAQHIALADELEAALSAAPGRCNRCVADLCEHDNCTDWTCARACGKCAPGPAPARDGVRKALERLSKACTALGQFKGDKTLYELSPIKDQSAYEAWLELNAAQKQARNILECAAKEQADGQ